MPVKEDPFGTLFKVMEQYGKNKALVEKILDAAGFFELVEATENINKNGTITRDTSDAFRIEAVWVMRLNKALDKIFYRSSGDL